MSMLFEGGNPSLIPKYCQSINLAYTTKFTVLSYNNTYYHPEYNPKGLLVRDQQGVSYAENKRNMEYWNTNERLTNISATIYLSDNN